MTKVVTSLVIVGAVTTVALVGAIALFTDTEFNPGSIFSTGTLDLAISPTSAMFTTSGMAPGDITYSGIQITNSGNLQLRYAMTTIADGNSTLDEQLDLTIDVVIGAGPDTIWYTADDVVGEATIYGPNGMLSAAAIGNLAQGAQPGDRTLAASGSERLRFKVTLPFSTDNSYQGKSCTVSFAFDAEQTANNP